MDQKIIPLNDYEAIIFDLGGVILNIDYNSTRDAFQALGLNDFDRIYSQASQSGLFDDLETGKISVQHFINKMLDHLPQGTSPNQVVAAWNAMLLDFPLERLSLLERLKQQKRIFLLSNTNAIHIQAFHRKLAQVSAHDSLHPYFEKVYYSSELGLRKPHPEVFLHLCKEQKLNPSEVLFIDDSIQHVQGARAAGLQVIHLTPGMEITELFVAN